MPDPVFTDTLELDLGDVVPSLAGPKRPEGRVGLSDAKANFLAALESEYRKPGDAKEQFEVEGKDFKLRHGYVVIAAITSCNAGILPYVLRQLAA
jgi:aconitate hydratase